MHCVLFLQFLYVSSHFPLILLFLIILISRNKQHAPNRNAVFNALAIDQSDGGAQFMFHANTLENAKDIVGVRGIVPSEGRHNCDLDPLVVSI